MKNDTDTHARLFSASRATIEMLEQRSLMSAGALDPTFGTDGQVVGIAYNNPFGFDTVVAQDAQGRPLVADGQQSGDNIMERLFRLSSNGSLDKSFGSGGAFTASRGRYDPYEDASIINRIIPEPDGNILLIDNGLAQVLNSSGTLISTYDISGNTGVLLPNGQLLCADGSSSNLYRYNANGTPDTTFGEDGVLTLSSPYDSMAIQDIALNATGQPILSLAVQLNSTTSAFGTARLTSGGALDSSYGLHGYALSASQQLAPASSRLAIAPNGAMDQLAVLRSSSFFIYAYSQNGASVGGGQFATPAFTDGNTYYDALNDISVQNDGKIIAVGSITQENQYANPVSIAVVDRFEAVMPGSVQSVTLDPAFNGSGTLQLGYSGEVFPPDAMSVLIDGSGRAVVSSIAGDNAGLAVARVLTSGSSATTSIPTTGAVIGTSGSWHNQGNTISKAFDGNLNTFFDAPSGNGGWVGLNLGSPEVLVQVSYARGAGWAQRMIGGMFQGSDTPGFSSDVQTLYTITSAPPVGQLTTIGLGDAGPFQYVRYLGPDGSYGNIAELKFFRAPMALAGTAIGTAGSYENQGNAIANAFDGDLTNFFDAPTASGGWVGLDLGSAQVVTQVEFAPRDSGWSGFAQRMVGGEIQASNSANFATGVVTLYTITSAPAAEVLTTASFTNTTAYRYYRYLGPADSYCNIAELVFEG